jgi:molybdopterin-guanine dinucleotide biosynthesis protein A
MFNVEGFILVGGASRRMGADKANLALDGSTSLERIIAELSVVACPISLVGARQDYRHLSLANVPDVHPGWGALAGIHAALAAGKHDWAAIVACDLPFVTRQLFERLRSLIDDSIDAVAPVQPDGRPQPLCALYRRVTCLPVTEKLIAQAIHTPRELLANVRTRWIESSELSDLPDSEKLFFNMNTPADFTLATGELIQKRKRQIE